MLTHINAHLTINAHDTTTQQQGSKGSKWVMESDKSSEDGPPSSLYTKMAVITHLLIFMYSASFWIQVGVMPFLSKSLGADPVVFGYMETLFAVAMLLGGPMFGRFGDLFGARAALLVAFLSSLLTYLTLALAQSIPALFLSRVFGFMMHAMHGAQMVMTDVSSTTQRADALGKLSVSYGVGMVVGPTLGGYITTYFSMQAAAAVATGLCLVSMVTVLLFIPATTKDPTKIARADNKEAKIHETGSVFNLTAILSLLNIPSVLFIVVVKAVVGVPAGVFHAMFTMVNLEKFQLTPESNGRLLSYVGVITMVMQGFGVGYFSKRFADSVLMRVSVAVMTVSYLLLSFADSILALCVVMIPMVMSGALLNTIASSTITKKVPETATGTSLGLSMATHSIIRTVSPTLGGYMYSLIGYPSFGLLGFVMNGAIAIYLVVIGSKLTEILG